jgi:alkylated DNA repair protein (DNA oxidative demethylase)
MTADLFTAPDAKQVIAEGAVLLHGFALPHAAALVGAIERITGHAPFRHMVTPGGFTMSVAMSNCGALGWVTEASGYRYDALDPQTDKPWPAMPEAFRSLATQAAREAGFEDFEADACLINCYEPGARMSLHQDRNEVDFAAPIVSVSLGLPATFLFGGLKRKDRPARLALVHGDVVVWGGPARLRFHGVSPLKEGSHPLAGRRRFNLTFRKAG